MNQFRYIPTVLFVLIATTLPVAAQPVASNDSSLTGELDLKQIDASFLKQMPFRTSPEEYYDTFPGALSQEFRGSRLLHVRGSRHDEIDYSFEDINIRSAFTGLPLLRFIPETLSEIELNTSPDAYTASSAALYNHRLRPPSKALHWSIQGESDAFTSRHNPRFGTFSYGYRSLTALGQGMSSNGKFRFLVGGEYEALQDHYRKFWPGFNFGGDGNMPVDDITGATLQDVFGVNSLTIQPGNIPEAEFKRYTLNGTVGAQFGSLDLKLITLYNFEEQQRNDSPIRFMFNPERIPVQRQGAGVVSLQSEYTAQNRLTFSFQFDYLRSANRTYDPIFKDNFFLYRDSLAIVERGLNWTAPDGLSSNTYLAGPGSFNFNSFQFNRPGDLLTNYAKRQENGWNVGAGMTKAFDNHLLSLGFNFEKRLIRQFAIGSSLGYATIIRQLGADPSLYSNQQLLNLRDDGDVRTFGFDLFGNAIDTGDEINDGARHPTSLAFYAGDRIRSENVIVELGLRYQRFATDALVYRNPLSPQVTAQENGNILPQTLTRSPATQYFLPRLAVTYAARQELSLAFTYGAYVQLPRLSDVYASRQTRIQNVVENTFGLLRNARGNNARPVETKQMEVSADYHPNMDFHASASFFTSTTRGRLLLDRIIATPDSPISSYLAYKNGDEDNTTGIELSAKLHHSGWKAFANYTLSQANGVASYPISTLSDLFESGRGDVNNRPKQALEYHQKHRGNLLVGYEFGAKAPSVLAGLSVHSLLQFHSGHEHKIFDGLPG